MQTREITRCDSPAFFNGFSRQHEGWLINLEIFGPEIGDQFEEREIALEGITAELGECQSDRIEIMMGAKPDDHITHTIAKPIQVSLEQSDDGADRVLAIKDLDANTTLLSFRAPVRSDMVDNLL